jgi:hypothetical protein
MSSDYMFGKDINSILESLARIEKQFGKSEKCRCKEHGKPPFSNAFLDYVTIVAPPAQPTPTSVVSRTGGIAWWPGKSGVDNGYRTPTPDRKEDFVLFGFMVSGLWGSVNYVDYEAINATIWPVVNKLYDDNISLKDFNYYDLNQNVKHTNAPDDLCVLGYYSRNANLWSWVAIQFNHTYQQSDNSCCWSLLFNMDGKPFARADDWNTLVFQAGRYQIALWNGNNLANYGINFQFQQIKVYP